MDLNEIVDRDSNQKLYAQVYTIFRGKIEKGDWSPVAQIPPEDELCRTYAVSKSTVRAAISELVREGFLKRLQGKGTFVTGKAPSFGIAVRTLLTEDMFGGGVKAQREVIEAGVKEPPKEVRWYLRTEEDVYCMLGRRTVDGDPAYIEESFIPLSMVPGVERHGIGDAVSFYDFIQEKAAKRIVKVIQTIELADIDERGAEFLKLSAGTAVILIHRSIIGSTGPIAYTRLYGSGRKYRVRTEFERVR